MLDHPEPASPDEERAYRAGFRWARQRDIDDPRVCDGLDEGPGTDGCIAYVRTARAGDARDDGDDRDDRHGDDYRRWR